MGISLPQAISSVLSLTAKSITGFRNVEEAIVNLDNRQNKDDNSVFRRENVISAISSLNPVPTDGWHLFEDDSSVENNNLVLIESGAISDRYTPKENDSIKVAGLRKDFNGVRWIDFEGGSKYYADPVLERETSIVTGDRYIDPAIPDKILVVGGESEDFPEGAIAPVLGKNYYYKRVGTEIERFPEINRNRLPIILRVELSGDLPLNSINPAAIALMGDNYQAYGIPFDLSPVSAIPRGNWNGISYLAEIDETIEISLSLNFKEHETQRNNISFIVIQNSLDGNNWNNYKILSQIRGEEGYFSYCCSLDVKEDTSYRIAILLSDFASNEDILLKEYSGFGIGNNGQEEIEDIDNAEVLMPPIISEAIITGSNVNFVDVEYTATIQLLSKQPTELILKLFDSNNVELNAQTYNNPIIGSTVTFGTANIDGFDGITPKQFYVTWEIN